MVAAATLYRAIADKTRRQILDHLRAQDLTAGALAGKFPRLSRPAISKHLAILRRSRLVRARRRGREQVYSLNAEPLREVGEWLKRYEAFMDQQLQSFKQYVEAETQKEKGHADAAH